MPETPAELKARIDQQTAKGGKAQSDVTGEVKVKPLEAYDPLKPKKPKVDEEPKQEADEDGNAFLIRRRKWKAAQEAKKSGQEKAMRATPQ